MATLSDMPWLGQPADPAGSLARGIQAGSMIAQTRNQRESLALRRMDFEAQQKERAALLPLEITMQQQQNKMNALTIEGTLEARQDKIKNESELLTLNKNVARAFTDAGGPEDAQQMLFESLTKNPRLISDPRFIELRKMVDTSLEARKMLIEARNQRAGVEDLGKPLIVTDPLTLQQKTYVRESANTISPFEKTDPNRPQSNLGRLFADRNNAFKAGRTDEVAAFDKKIALEQAERGFSLTTNPDGTVTASYGASSLTPANQTRVQQGLSDSLSTIDIANRLEPLIDTETVGARSFVETWVKDRVLAQAFPEMASNKRASAESLAAQLRASAVRELKTDSNITEKERSQILQSIPDINAPIDSPARAKQLIGDIRKMSAIRAVVSAVKLGQPMPKAAAQALSDDELVRLANTGVITQEQALQIFDARQ